MERENERLSAVKVFCCEPGDMVICYQSIVPGFFTLTPIRHVAIGQGDRWVDGSGLPLAGKRLEFVKAIAEEAKHVNSPYPGKSESVWAIFADRADWETGNAEFTYSEPSKMRIDGAYRVEQWKVESRATVYERPRED